MFNPYKYYRTIFILKAYIVIIMSSESHDEISDRGAAAQQEQDRIIMEANRPIKGKQTERQDPKGRGEAVE
jgi:hypothetical protein